MGKCEAKNRFFAGEEILVYMAYYKTLIGYYIKLNNPSDIDYAKRTEKFNLVINNIIAKIHKEYNVPVTERVLLYSKENNDNCISI